MQDETRYIPGVGMVRKHADGTYEVLVAPGAAPQGISAVPLPVNPVRAAKEQRQEVRQDAADKRAEAAAVRADRSAERQAAAAERSAAAQAKPTEFQSKSAGFLGRMMEAEKNFNAVPETERGARGLFRQTLHNALPGVENTLVNSADRQKADQAVENFIAASLRQESGAAISPMEFERQYKIFFPAPGDTPEVIAQKAAARAQAIGGFKIAAGPLADAAAGTTQQRADNEVPDPTTGAATKPGTNPVDPGAMPPANAPGGNDPSPMPEAPRYSVATGQTRTVHNAKVSAQIDAMMNAGASEAVINAALKQQGLAPIDPHSHAAAKAWMMQHPGKRYYGTDINTEVPLSGMEKAAASPVAAGITGAANSLTLGGLDEGIGGIEALRNGTSWADETAKADGAKKAIAALNPGSSIAGELGGTVLQALAGGKALSMFPNVAKAIATARGTLATGTGYGAINGALESNDDRTLGGVLGGSAGLGGSVVGRTLVAPAVEKIARRFSGVEGVTAAERALPDVPESVLTNLEDAKRLGLPYSLADADPKLRMLAGSVARKSPGARQLAEAVFDPRALGQADRAVQAIDTHLAPVTNIAERGKELIAAGNQASSPHYTMARQRAAPVDPEIAAMLETPAGKNALVKARELAANEGRDPNGLGFDLNEQGDVVLREMPSFETLQYVKRGLDGVVEGHRNAVGVLDLQGDPMAQAVDGLRSRFNQRLGSLNEHYAAGNAEYAKWAKARDALEMGHGTLPNQSLPLRDFQAGLAGLTEDTMPEAQRGFATAMADRANQARESANPYSSIYGSPLQQQKVGELFPDGAANFDRVHGLERDMSKTRTETIGGSPTAARTAADQLFEGPAGTILDVGTGAITGGGFPAATALKSGARLLGDNWRLGVGQKRADELAPALFNTNPSEAIDYLSELFARQSALQARKQAYGSRGTLLGSIIAPALIPSQ